VLAAFCAASLVFLAVSDLTVPEVRDVEVWLGFELRGLAALATAPLHWALFAFGAWMFWCAKPWAWRAAAAYLFYVALSHLVWSEASPNGQGWRMGLLQAAAFSGLAGWLLRIDAGARARRLRVEGLLEQITAWAARTPDVRALALVGSYARGAAGPDSDVDLLLLALRPAELVDAQGWLAHFGAIDTVEIEPFGRVASLRVRYRGGPEVEFGLTSPDWAREPDAGSLRVARDGLRVLWDPEGCFTGLPVRAD
jgi:predicted nucleotidyltransferase